MAQHGGNSVVPLKFKTLSQLVGFFWRRLTPTPHLRPHGLYGSIRSHKVAVGSLSALVLKQEAPGQMEECRAVREPKNWQLTR